MNKSILLITTLLLLTSCGGMSAKDGKASLANHEDQFNYTDKNGQYVVRTSSGLDKQGKSFFYKKDHGNE